MLSCDTNNNGLLRRVRAPGVGPRSHKWQESPGREWSPYYEGGLAKDILSRGLAAGGRGTERDLCSFSKRAVPVKITCQRCGNKERG